MEMFVYRGVFDYCLQSLPVAAAASVTSNITALLAANTNASDRVPFVYNITIDPWLLC